jgi:hypothetical protein
MGDLVKQGLVTPQGKQGMWATKSALTPHLTQIHSIAELDAFLL